MTETGSTDALLKLLGPAGLIVLAERHGGTRLYVPSTDDYGSLAAELGEEIAAKLSRRYGGDYLRVPLARELRARHYRAAGAANAQIAVRLGMTEPGVNQMFARIDNVPAKGSGSAAQLKLFG